MDIKLGYCSACGVKFTDTGTSMSYLPLVTCGGCGVVISEEQREYIIGVADVNRQIMVLDKV